MSTIAFPMPPNPSEHNRLARFIRELREADARSPKPQTVTIWDGTQNRFRAVDPGDTADFLHAAAVEYERLLEWQRARSATRPVGRPRKTRWWSRVTKWLPSFTASRDEARRHVAECYLEAARKAAREGRHIEAQHHARCSVVISRGAGV